MYYEYDEYEHFSCPCAITTITTDSSDTPITSDWFVIQDGYDEDDPDEWLEPYEEFLETLE